MTVKNAKQLPSVFYGLHMCEGVAEYREPDSKPYRIMIGEDAIKNMDPTFQGRPVYVQHVDDVDMDNLQAEADGYVVESFFNKADGKHWAKFIIVSDRGHEAIRSGWKLSNAYIPKTFTGGGLWHGVDYQKEVTSGEYEHLAIVPNPRYEESVILTPEEFKEYCGEKEIELKRLANSKEGKGENSMKLNFFTKKKVENSTDLEGTSVVLPKSGKEITIAKLVNDMDEVEMNADKPKMADGEHHVMVGEHKMTVNDLVKKHMDMCNELEEMKKKHDAKDESEADKDAHDEEKQNDESDEEAKKKALELAEHEEKEIMEEKKNDEQDKHEAHEAEKADEAKKQNAAEKAEKKKNFDAIKNAHLEAYEKTAKVDLSDDKVSRGKSRYGSAQA